MLVLSFAVDLILNVVLTVIHATAIALTTVRLRYRIVMQRFWWDDFVAMLAVIGDCIYLAALWLAYAGASSVLQTHRWLVIRYWLGLMLFILVIWMTRISLALAIARIFPPRNGTRRFAIGLATGSTTLCLVVVIQASVICAKQPALNDSPQAACQWPNSLRTLVVVANILCDSLLVATPLYKLWRVRLRRKQRRLILGGGFTAGITTMTATVTCAVFQFAPERWEPAKTDLRGKLNYLETGISLIVCNLLVVITYFYTITHRESNGGSYDTTSGTCEFQPDGSISRSNSNTVTPTHLTLTQITEGEMSSEMGTGTQRSDPTRFGDTLLSGSTELSSHMANSLGVLGSALPQHSHQQITSHTS